MKTTILFYIATLPMLLTAQLEGTYTHWVFVGGRSIVFSKDGFFEFHSRGVGKGSYVIHQDTLTLRFGKHMEERFINCSSTNVDYGTPDILDDSVRFFVSVLDCGSLDTIPFPVFGLIDPQNDSIIAVKEVYANDVGRLVVSARKDSLILFMNAPEYFVSKVPIQMRHPSSIHVEARLFLEPWGGIIEEGTIWRYRILEKKRRHLKLETVDYEDKVTLFYVKVKEKWSFDRWRRRMERYFPELKKHK
ncbi:MAG: hypothetical protein AAGI38_19385 [Bacteroidota bacterium]